EATTVAIDAAAEEGDAGPDDLAVGFLDPSQRVGWHRRARCRARRPQAAQQSATAPRRIVISDQGRPTLPVGGGKRVGSSWRYRASGPRWAKNCGSNGPPVGLSWAFLALQLANRKCNTSPSLPALSLPPSRFLAASLAGTSPPNATKSL